MPEVDISIGGRKFQVVCNEGEEHFLHSAAAMLDIEAQPLIEQMGRMPESRMLLMAGLMLADKTAAGRTDRLSVARAAQLEAIARHAIKPLPVLADPDDDRHVDRSEAQDLHAWND